MMLKFMNNESADGFKYSRYRIYCAKIGNRCTGYFDNWLEIFEHEQYKAEEKSARDN